MNNTTAFPQATKQVNITGTKPPDINMTILDFNGSLRKFHIREMLLQGQAKETNRSRQERTVVYYKGRVEVVERFDLSIKTKIFKYIPSSKTWYICGEYEDLLRTQRFINN